MLYPSCKEIPRDLYERNCRIMKALSFQLCAISFEYSIREIDRRRRGGIGIESKKELLPILLCVRSLKISALVLPLFVFFSTPVFVTERLSLFKE